MWQAKVEGEGEPITESVRSSGIALRNCLSEIVDPVWNSVDVVSLDVVSIANAHSYSIRGICCSVVCGVTWGTLNPIIQRPMA